MKIKDLKVFIVGNPPPGWGGRYFTFVRLTTDNGIAFSETVTVNEAADTLGVPGDKNFLWEINYSQDIYAKGKGLVFREFHHETWQPPNITCGSGCYEVNSYGIRLRYLNSNR